jgi:outer membrane protein assembly factor BamB
MTITMKILSFRTTAIALLLVTCKLSITTADDWPQWRGPNRGNISKETGLLKEWPKAGPPLVWEVKGLGNGIASPAVAGKHIYTLGYIDDSEYVTALDKQTGERIWATRIGAAVKEHPYMRWLRNSPEIESAFVKLVESWMIASA